MSSSPFQVGQRWANTAETEMGVGIVTQVAARTVVIFFPDAEESRQYAIRNAPLARIEYQIGDTVEHADGQGFRVVQKEERGGLHFYDLEAEDGTRRVAAETQLKGSQQQAAPLTRLLQGQNDTFQNFSLRLQTWALRQHYQSLDVAGLMGGRVDLIPHQFHIASQASRQRYPRVMLADEVGLGKTIEAGLILHRLLLDGQIERVLIVVPDALIHQWLVEMLRRFNLRLRLLDEEQCEAICESQHTDNPFTAEQCVLCSVDFLLANPQWQQAAIEAPWDMLVIDEAHHLAWHPEGASERYELVERLSSEIPGLLLLTATPEKEGHQSHFAQLHLLDPRRYHDFNAFVAAQDGFGEVAAVAEQLFDAHAIDASERARLDALLPDASSQSLINALLNDHEGDDADALQRRLAQRLIDRHGTGRALFRNSRASIPGFPRRELHTTLLEMPADYQKHAAVRISEALYPEAHVRGDRWLTIDPRVGFLTDLLKKHRQKKFLVICHHDDTALALGEHLSLRGGVLATTFHRDMTLIERDRAAAWFADLECGAQVLVCSEIGSEGRNFQFCHHLVLFDLPCPVDLLEQRIGRLDRIGQKHDIQIHVPCFANSAQSRLLEWYRDGLDAFLASRASHTVAHDEFVGEFERAWRDGSDMTALIQRTRARVDALDEQFRHGRNRLLELHSRGSPDDTQALLDRIREQDDAPRLRTWLEQVFTQFGIEEEDLSDTSFVLRPGPHFEESQFGFIDEEGLGATCDRATALARDDLAFLTLDHPLVLAAQDLVITSGRGSASLALLKNRQIREGTLMLETLYTLECLSPRHMQLQRFLPATPIRVFLDQQRRDLSAAVNSDTLDKQLKNVKGELVGPLIQQVKTELAPMLGSTLNIAEQRSNGLLDAAIERFRQHYEEELHRLEAMQAEGAPVSEEELNAVREHLASGLALLRDKSRLQLDAIRLIVAVA